MATPRTEGRQPCQRVRPAFPESIRVSGTAEATSPFVAKAVEGMLR